MFKHITVVVSEEWRIRATTMTKSDQSQHSSDERVDVMAHTQDFILNQSTVQKANPVAGQCSWSGLVWRDLLHNSFCSCNSALSTFSASRDASNSFLKDQRHSKKRVRRVNREGTMCELMPRMIHWLMHSLMPLIDGLVGALTGALIYTLTWVKWVPYFR